MIQNLTSVECRAFHRIFVLNSFRSGVIFSAYILPIISLPLNTCENEKIEINMKMRKLFIFIVFFK